VKLLDVNILVYAHRADQTQHEFYRSKLEQLLTSDEICGLTLAAAIGFVRVVTQPKFPNGPTPLPQALAVIETLMTEGGCHWVQMGPKHWNIFADLCRQTGCVGKSVSDASHAASAIENGCTWISRDADFSRFTPHGLRWEKWL
jgi:toxin-antitoxin system PIN domain toxin